MGAGGGGGAGAPAFAAARVAFSLARADCLPSSAIAARAKVCGKCRRFHNGTKTQNKSGIWPKSVKAPHNTMRCYASFPRVTAASAAAADGSPPLRLADAAVAAAARRKAAGLPDRCKLEGTEASQSRRVKMQ